MDELELVERLVEAGWRGSRDVLLGPGDDAAVLRGGIVVSTDMMIEGIHFRASWATPREIGFRAAAGALSDMAAMGATPVAVLVSLAVPTADDRAVEIQTGIAEAAGRVSASIVGGDVSRSPGPVIVDVVTVGRARDPVTRAGGRAGDDLWVSGALGGAALAVAAWTGGREPSAGEAERFLRPPDRTSLGVALAGEGLATAMIDVSDGLEIDAARLARRSGVAAVLRAPDIPLLDEGGAETLRTAEGLNHALRGGEDYELLFASAPASGAAIERLSSTLGVPLTRVGRLEHGDGVTLELADGRRQALDGGGFDHFVTRSSSQ